jgi:hypothetical protein
MSTLTQLSGGTSLSSRNPAPPNQATRGNYRDHGKARSGSTRRLVTLGLAATARAEWDDVEVLLCAAGEGRGG